MPPQDRQKEAMQHVSKFSPRVLALLGWPWALAVQERLGGGGGGL